MIPLDGSPRSECAIPVASQIARTGKAKLLLAHVVAKPEIPRRTPLPQEDMELVNKLIERNHAEAQRYMKQLESRLTSSEVDLHTGLAVSDNVASSLHDMVEKNDVDLVVLSAHGYAGETKWPFGNIVANFTCFGTTPLLVVQDLSLREIDITQAEDAAKQYKGH
jgi:nucleotide-binding universal stress UspA family protein